MKIQVPLLRYKFIEEINKSKKYESSLKKLKNIIKDLKIQGEMLSGIEDRFILSDILKKKVDNDNSEVLSLIKKKSDLFESTGFKVNYSKFIKETEKREENPARTFARYYAIVSGWGNNFLSGKDTIDIINNSFPYHSSMKQVFLSYAYKDKGLAILLFLFFYINGIYLYVDFLHNKKISSGVIIKKSLSRELCKSAQLLLLLTVNSELHLSGGRYIRPWCAWETGLFSLSKVNEEFLYRRYNENQGKGNSGSEDIQLVEGMNRFSYLQNGIIKSYP